MVVGVGFGGRTLDVTNIKSLHINGTTIGAGAFSVLTDDAGASYSVPATKSLIIDKVIYHNGGSTVPDSAEFGYADDAAGTNFQLVIPKRIFSDRTTQTTSTTDALMRVAATKFPIVRAGSANTDLFLYVRGMEV